MSLLLEYYRPSMSIGQEYLIEVSLMYKEYKATVVYAMGGNIGGASVLKSAIDNFEDGHLDSFPTENEFNQKHLDFIDPENKYSDAETIYLYKEDGSNIGFSFDDEILGDLVISAKITSYES